MSHCIKCKYFSQGIMDPRMLCNHPEALIGKEPVTGVAVYFTCTEMRDLYTCGKEGVFFVPVKRNTFFTMLKNWFVN